MLKLDLWKLLLDLKSIASDILRYIFEPAEWIRYIAIYLNLPSEYDTWPADKPPIYLQKSFISTVYVYLAHNVSVNIHDNQTALSSRNIHLRRIILKTRIVMIIVIMKIFNLLVIRGPGTSGNGGVCKRIFSRLMRSLSFHKV